MNTKHRKISRVTVKNWLQSSVKSIMTWRKWINWRRHQRRSKVWRTKSGQASRRLWVTKKVWTRWAKRPRRWRVLFLIVDYAQEFEKNSEKLERMLYWRNCKLKIIAIIFIVAILGFVILIIVQAKKWSRWAVCCYAEMNNKESSDADDSRLFH